MAVIYLYEFYIVICQCSLLSSTSSVSRILLYNYIYFLVLSIRSLNGHFTIQNLFGRLLENNISYSVTSSNTVVALAVSINTIKLLVS